MRDNEYNQNMTNEYSAGQEEYSRAKGEFTCDSLKEYGAGAKELEFPKEYGVSAESSLEENAKKNRSFRKQMLKMFTAATASVVLVVSSNFVSTAPKQNDEIRYPNEYNDNFITTLPQHPDEYNDKFITSSSEQTTDRICTDKYNTILDQLMMLAEEENYDGFDEILKSPEMEECIEFFRKQERLLYGEGYYVESTVSFIYDGEYARDSNNWEKNQEDHENEGMVLEFQVMLNEEGKDYRVMCLPNCGRKSSHIEQQGSFKNVQYYLSDTPYAHYNVYSGEYTESYEKSLYKISKDLDTGGGEILSSLEVFCEYWDNGPRGTCIWKEEHEEEGYGVGYSKEITAVFDDEGVLIPEQCIMIIIDYYLNEEEVLEERIDYIDDYEYFEWNKQWITDMFYNQF